MATEQPLLTRETVLCVEWSQFNGVKSINFLQMCEFKNRSLVITGHVEKMNKKKNNFPATSTIFARIWKCDSHNWMRQQKLSTDTKIVIWMPALFSISSAAFSLLNFAPAAGNDPWISQIPLRFERHLNSQHFSPACSLELHAALKRVGQIARLALESCLVSY